MRKPRKVYLITQSSTSEIYIYKNLKRCWEHISKGVHVMMVLSEDTYNGSAEIKTYLHNYVGLWRYFFEEHKIIISAFNKDTTFSRRYVIQEKQVM